MEPKVDSRIVRDLDSIPTLPSVVTRILEIVLDDKSSARDAGKIVEADQALAAKVLKIVNSPAYGLRQKVSTVSHAIAMLGFGTLKSLVLSVSVYEGLLEGKKDTGLDKSLYWQHCLAVAAASRALAKEMAFDLPDEAYVAGLLHDIGKIILDQRAREDYRRVLARAKGESCVFVQAEREVLGSDHSEVGGWVAEKWNLPPILQDAIRYHHADLAKIDLPQRNLQLVALTHVADFLAWTQGIGSVEARVPPLLDLRAEEIVGLKKIKLDTITEAIDEEMEKMAEVFRFPTPDIKRFRGALQKANVELGRINSLYDDARRQLERRVKELTELNEAIRRARQTLDPRQVQKTILETVHDGLGFDRVSFFEWKEGKLACSGVQDGTHLDLDLAALTFPSASGDAFLDRCRAHQRPFRFAASGEDAGSRILRQMELSEAAVAPVICQKDLLGVILADRGMSRSAIGDADIESLGILANEAGLAIENARLFQRTLELARVDELTTVFNRRQTMESLTLEMERSRRYKRPFTLAMCDIDHFKKVNDTYGHLAGDQILQGVAKLIRGTSRDVDIVGRYGGEEFIVLLPETDLDAAIVYAERVRKTVEKWGTGRKELNPGHNVSISIGVASYDATVDKSGENFIEKADKALYAAKERGRNRVCVYR